MSNDYGQWGSIVAIGGNLVAVATAFFSTWTKRTQWTLIDDDVGRIAQRFGGLVVAVGIGVLWFRHRPGQESWLDLDTLSLVALGIAALCIALYIGLRTSCTFDREIATGPASTTKHKVLGGFALTEAAKKALAENPGLSLQELFKGGKFDLDKVWTPLSRAVAKIVLVFTYLGTVAGGTLALASISIGLAPSAQPSNEQALATATQRWIEAADAARQNRTVTPGAPLPTDLAAARTEFEVAWRQGGLGDRSRLDPDLASRSLGYVVKLYRLQETNEAVKTNSLHWADEAIRYFEERQDRPRLVEALLDKAAIMLDLSQLENASRDDFEKFSKSGDELMTRTAGIASDDKKAEVLRLSSRFYYNLARPRSFRLSDNWDNNYLLLALDKARKAQELAPDDLKNANQLLRATIKVAKNPPQDADAQWTTDLRTAQSKMKTLWQQKDGSTNDATSRLPALSVLGTGTLEVVAHEWQFTAPAARRQAAPRLLDELQADALPKLREAEALLRNGELKNAFGFDVYYDIARAHAQRVVMLRVLDRGRAAKEFQEVLANAGRARDNAKATQLDAAVKDVTRDLSFSKLAPQERSQLAELLRVGATK